MRLKAADHKCSMPGSQNLTQGAGSPYLVANVLTTHCLTSHVFGPSMPWQQPHSTLQHAGEQLEQVYASTAESIAAQLQDLVFQKRSTGSGLPSLQPTPETAAAVSQALKQPPSVLLKASAGKLLFKFLGANRHSELACRDQAQHPMKQVLTFNVAQATLLQHLKRFRH